MLIWIFSLMVLFKIKAQTTPSNSNCTHEEIDKKYKLDSSEWAEHPFTSRDLKGLMNLMPPFLNLHIYLLEANDILEIGY